ncbi:hypothetical protein ACJIZ3_001545 [Penstemon smallii]|uniref:DDT domain-containing protein DDR4 n=1 Tax=Penstemon smallii TaxID=265156 RepID=A0ABD3U417_9LAMI
MAEASRRTLATIGNAQSDDFTLLAVASPPDTVEIDSVRKELRQRWELASILNFLHVFEPVIESNIKISAEEMETALIQPNSTLAQLHIALLKGILPVKKTLKSSDEWIVALSKALAAWWPWVAEGDFPLSGVKGEEISNYKELDPTVRLLILKALCEARADQYDVGSYVNEAMKNGTEVSAFRKDKLAGDGKGISYWYDGSETTGHRLYKEVLFIENEQVKRKDTMPAINCQWETLATSFEEFNKTVRECQSSRVKMEVDLSKSLEADVIPVLEKLWKKKQNAHRRKQREQMLLNNFRNSGITRSCRNQKPIDYRYDDYDRAIAKAILIGNKKKTSEEQGQEKKQSKHKKRMLSTSNESYSSDTNSSDARRNNRSNDSDDSSHEEYEEKKEDDANEYGDKVNSQQQKQNTRLIHRSKDLRFSKRLAGIPGHTLPESMNLGAKNKLRQRPSLNTAAESVVVPDSEDEKS